MTSMWETIIGALSRPETWTIVLGILYAAAIGAAQFVIKRFGFKFRIMLKTPKVDQTALDKLISREFSELKEKYRTDMADWKSKYLNLEGLFEVSRSQWSEKIEELTVENGLLKAQIRFQNQGQPEPGHVTDGNEQKHGSDE